MRKLYLFLVMLITLVSQQTLGQNPAWSLPKMFYRNGLSSLPTTNDYNGSPAVAASNMQLDAQNNILFFIVNGVVYNKYGEELDAFYGSNTLGEIKGDAEMTVIPDPASCSRYYIIASGQVATYESMPYYGVFDISLSSPSTSGAIGAFVKFPDGKTAKSIRDLVTDDAYDFQSEPKHESVALMKII